MKNLLSKVALAAALATTAQADGYILDLKVGAGSTLDVDPGGSMIVGSEYTLDGTLGLKNSAQTYMYAEFDHLIPLVPNIKYEKQTLSFTGTATQTVSIGGASFTASTASQFSWDHEDAIFYWGIPFSTWIPMIDAADFGLGIKLGNMNMGVDGVAGTEFTLGSVYGYGRMHVSPPFLLGLGFEVEVKSIKYDATDGVLNFNERVYKADWMIEAPIPVIDLSVGVEAGYRSMSYLISTGGVTFDLGFSGIFFGVVGKFGI